MDWIRGHAMQLAVGLLTAIVLALGTFVFVTREKDGIQDQEIKELDGESELILQRNYDNKLGEIEDLKGENKKLDERIFFLEQELEKCRTSK